MGDGIEDMNFDERVKVAKSLAKAVLPGRWHEFEKGDALKCTGRGVLVGFSSGDAQEPEASRDAIRVTYLSSGMGDAYHLYDHYESLFGSCCDVSLRADKSGFVKVE